MWTHFPTLMSSICYFWASIYFLRYWTSVLFQSARIWRYNYWCEVLHEITELVHQLTGLGEFQHKHSFAKYAQIWGTLDVDSFWQWPYLDSLLWPISEHSSRLVDVHEMQGMRDFWLHVHLCQCRPWEAMLWHDVWGSALACRALTFDLPIIDVLL